MTEDPVLDYYLVLTGPKTTPRDSRTLRPWVISAAYLFEAHQLLAEQRSRGVRVGVASGVRKALWQAAELYPTAKSTAYNLTDEQRARLALFAPVPAPE